MPPQWVSRGQVLVVLHIGAPASAGVTAYGYLHSCLCPASAPSPHRVRTAGRGFRVAGEGLFTLWLLRAREGRSVPQTVPEPLRGRDLPAFRPSCDVAAPTRAPLSRSIRCRGELDGVAGPYPLSCCNGMPLSPMSRLRSTGSQSGGAPASQGLEGRQRHPPPLDYDRCARDPTAPHQVLDKSMQPPAVRPQLPHSRWCERRRYPLGTVPIMK